MIPRSPKSTSGDYTVVAGELIFVDEEDYIRQSWEERLRFFMGEYRYDSTIGVPYFQKILIKGFNVNIVRGVFISETLKSPGIKSVKKLTLDFNASSRTMNVSCDAQSDVGLLSLFTSLPVGP